MSTHDFTFFQSVERNENEQGIINKGCQRQRQYDLSNTGRGMSHKLIELCTIEDLFFFSTATLESVGRAGSGWEV
jgi:hypothetical protein